MKTKKMKNTKKEKAKLWVVVFGMLLFGVFFSNLVSAANIGISPAKISFKDVLRGGYSEKFVTITIDSDEPVSVTIQKRGEIEDWLSFEETEFEVSKSNPYRMKIMAEPPIDMPNGIYQGFIRVRISGEGEAIEGQATGIVNAALDLNVEIEVTDIESKACSATKFRVESVEIGDPIIFSALIYNEGNIRLKPNLRVEIWDENQIEIIKQEDFVGKEIFPTTSEEIVFEVDSSGMDLGQYWVDFYALDCYNSQTLTFDILEVGALKASGILTSIISVPWVEKGDTTMIQAFFENNGEKSVRAQFKGEITLNGNIIQILESQNSLVNIEDTKEFDFYFTPQKVGKYIVSGRVFYDGKRTFEKNAIINVRDTGFRWNNLIRPLVYVLLILGISYLLYKINQEKKSFKKHRRKK